MSSSTAGLILFDVEQYKQQKFALKVINERELFCICVSIFALPNMKKLLKIDFKTTFQLYKILNYINNCDKFLSLSSFVSLYRLALWKM